MTNKDTPQDIRWHGTIRFVADIEALKEDFSAGVEVHKQRARALEATFERPQTYALEQVFIQDVWKLADAGLNRGRTRNRHESTRIRMRAVLAGMYGLEGVRKSGLALAKEFDKARETIYTDKERALVAIARFTQRDSQKPQWEETLRRVRRHT